MSSKKALEESIAKGVGADFWDAGFPPIRGIRPVVKTDPPEKTRITQNKRAPGLPQNKVIVFAGNERGVFDAQGSGHSQVNA